MPRILYVDDEPDIREIAKMSLELDPELEVRTCDGGPGALELAEEWAPDLILLDVMMPGMDGPATLARLRERSAGAAVPVVFITARTQEKETTWLLGLGARSVIAKPFDPMRLAEQVRKLLP